MSPTAPALQVDSLPSEVSGKHGTCNKDPNPFPTTKYLLPLSYASTCVLGHFSCVRAAIVEYTESPVRDTEGPWTNLMLSFVKGLQKFEACRSGTLLLM